MRPRNKTWKMGKVQSKLPRSAMKKSLEYFEAHEIDDVMDIFQRLREDEQRQQEAEGKMKSTHAGIDIETFGEYFSYPGVLRQQIFRVFDTNMDGLIDREEFMRGLVSVIILVKVVCSFTFALTGFNFYSFCTYMFSQKYANVSYHSLFFSHRQCAAEANLTKSYSSASVCSTCLAMGLSTRWSSISAWPQQRLPRLLCCRLLLWNRDLWGMTIASSQLSLKRRWIPW